MLTRRETLQRLLTLGAALVATPTTVVETLAAPRQSSRRRTLIPFRPLEEKDWVHVERPEYRFAKSELIETIDYAAWEMYTRFGAAPLTVHDLSKEYGGVIRNRHGGPKHKSHHNGRDADVGLYFNTALWDNICSIGNKFAPAPFNDQITTQVNWHFIRTLQQGPVDIDRIFLDAKYIRKLQEYVRASHGEHEATEEWKNYGSVLKHAPGHRDHYHIRIA